MRTTLRTARLTLRHLRLDDAPFILDLLNDPGFIANIGDRKVRTPYEAHHYLHRTALDLYAKRGWGNFLVLQGETPIGVCSLVQRDYLRDVDVGFAFLPSFRGQGLAFEATQAVLEFCRSDLQLKRVVAIALPENLASVSLLERLGLKREGEVTAPEDGKILALYALEWH